MVTVKVLTPGITKSVNILEIVVTASSLVAAAAFEVVVVEEEEETEKEEENVMWDYNHEQTPVHK